MFAVSLGLMFTHSLHSCIWGPGVNQSMPRGICEHKHMCPDRCRACSMSDKTQVSILLSTFQSHMKNMCFIFTTVTLIMVTICIHNPFIMIHHKKSARPNLAEGTIFYQVHIWEKLTMYHSGTLVSLIDRPFI